MNKMEDIITLRTELYALILRRKYGLLENNIKINMIKEKIAKIGSTRQSF